MEGPTPVSALLHAATMVTAGIFLVLRCSYCLEYSNTILILINLLGGLTAFFFAIVSIFQYDIKKIIAYSTCSQLGYMFFSCGLSHYNVAIFHLFNHAFFKALLFLGAGSIIHALLNEQDMRRMGNYLIVLPFTYICIFIGSLAIIGFPFLTGFYSKDLILELAISRYVVDGMFIYFLGIAAAFFTAVYSIKLLFFVFCTYNNSFKKLFFSIEASVFMAFTMSFLGFLSIFIGYLFSDFFLG
jgi:NADH-ubiquinone oxidoreductase chain 5